MQTEQKQCLVAYGAALLFCLRCKPSVRFVVGIDDDLLHVSMWVNPPRYCRCNHTRQQFFRLTHFFSTLFIGVLKCRMPNRRKPGKKKIGVWITDAEKHQIDAMLDKHGVRNVAELLRAVREGRVTISPAAYALLLSAVGAQQSGCGGALVALAILAGLALCML